MTPQTDEEIKFLSKIDCNFPYDNKQECLQLIDEAILLSTNAVFSVAEEICRVPISKEGKVEKQFLIDLLNLIRAKFSHPLKELILSAAERIVYKKQEQTIAEVISHMTIVKGYPGQFAALNILYFSCEDKDNKLDHVMDRIVNQWKS